jgi:DNA-binding CsgD family transcriptional regulator
MHDDIETLFESFEVVWPHATAQRLKRLDAHFQRGLNLLQQLDNDRAVLRNVEAVIAQIETAILIIDRSMRLHYANPAGQALPQREDGLRLRRGLVTPRYPEDQREFSFSIAARSSKTVQDPGAPADKPFSIFEIRRNGSPRPYRASVFPLTTVHATARLAQSADLVMFVDDPDRADTAGDGESELFRRAFRLTPAETRLASSLASGASLDQAADAIQVTRHTARTRNHQRRDR